MRTKIKNKTEQARGMEFLIFKGLLNIVIASLVVVSIFYMFVLLYNAQSRMEQTSKDLFVQIEQIFDQMEDETGKHVPEQEELSAVFALLLADEGTVLYAVDPEDGRILGATDATYEGTYLEEHGILMTDVVLDDGFFMEGIAGNGGFVVFTEIHGIWVARSCTNEVLYRSIFDESFAFIGLTLLITVFIFVAMVRFLNNQIVSGLNEVNDKLVKIADGKLDEKVDVSLSSEFIQLGEHINFMVDRLLDTTDKISDILDIANVPIGVFIYGINMRKVRTTSQVQNLLGISEEKLREIAMDYSEFEGYLDTIRKHPVKDEEGVYEVPGSKELYIRLDEYYRDNECFGVLADVTENIVSKKQLEEERDTDKLTGLYNRRALDHHMEELFENPEELKHLAVVMVDADGLKAVNDLYGHEKGDRYLQEIARVLDEVKIPNKVLARQGGDEFVLVFWGCETKEELEGYIAQLRAHQSNLFISLGGDIKVPLRYSLGYTVFPDQGDNFKDLLAHADMQMYDNKKRRKLGME